MSSMRMCWRPGRICWWGDGKGRVGTGNNRYTEVFQNERRMYGEHFRYGRLFWSSWHDFSVFWNCAQNLATRLLYMWRSNTRFFSGERMFLRIFSCWIPCGVIGRFVTEYFEYRAPIVCRGAVYMINYDANPRKHLVRFKLPQLVRSSVVIQLIERYIPWNSLSV